MKILKRTLCFMAALLFIFATACSNAGTANSTSTPYSSDGTSSDTDSWYEPDPMPPLFGYPCGATVHSGKTDHIYGDSVPQELKDTTVYYATWVDHTATLGAVPLANFYADTGINVELITCQESGYVDVIKAKVASGNAPDVFVAPNSSSFPLTFEIAAPINKVSNVCICDQKLNSMFLKQFTVDGNVYYLDTYSSPYADASILFYNKRLFEEYGFKTPKEYYVEGRLTWDNLAKLMRDIKALGPDYKGGVIALQDVISSCGGGHVKYDSATHAFSKNTDGIKLVQKAQEWYSNAKNDGLLDGSINAFCNNKCGILISDTNALRVSGIFNNMDPEDIGFSCLPTLNEYDHPYVPTEFNYHGIVNGSSNPNAAVYFILYWLDDINYDLNNTFLTREAGLFYYEYMNYSMNRHFNYDDTLASLVENGYRFGNDTKDLDKNINTAVNAANKIINDKLEADRNKYK